MSLAGNHKRLYVLLASSQTPIKSRVLAGELGIHDRQVRDLVPGIRDVLRGSGQTILGNATGYWLETDPAIIDREARRLRQHAISELRSARSIRRAVHGTQIDLGL